MMSKLKWLIYKPTFFFVLGLISILVSIPLFIYMIGLDGGASLGALLPLCTVLIALPLILLDRVFVKLFKRAWILSIIEILLLIILVAYLKYDHKRIIIDMENSNQQYLIIKYKSTGADISSFNRYGLFDKKYTLNKGNVLTINEETLGEYKLVIIPPKYWEGYSYTGGKDKNGTKCDFYTGTIGTTGITLNDKDSLINANENMKNE